jgi:HKD family nuclease
MSSALSTSAGHAAHVSLITSPGDSYLTRVCEAIATADYFCLISGFVSQAGIEQIAPSLRSCFGRRGQGRLLIAVDRQGFNAAPMFESLLELKREFESQFSIGIVQGLGLMHAKALFTENEKGNQVIVGSANLTRAAFAANQELGLAATQVPKDVRHAFRQFEAKLHARDLSLENADEFLASIGVSRPRTRLSHPRRESANLQSLSLLQPRPTPAIGASEELRDWAQAGFIVGVGRRESEALVLRVPMQQLQERGLVTSIKVREVGASSYERRSSAFGVLLFPRAIHEQLGKFSRQISYFRTRLSLSLPCFGEWMPKQYWPVFEEATLRKRAQALDFESLLGAASMHRKFLLDQGGLEVEVVAITAGLAEVGRINANGREALGAALVAHFRNELVHRAPELLARCLDFRTVRQLWSPHEQTDEPLRAFAIDVAQACFATTLRTGEWPHRFRSEVAGALVRDLRERMGELDIATLPLHATMLLDASEAWFEPETPLERVAKEFRDRFMRPDELPEIDVSMLLGEEEGGDLDEL